MSAGEVVGRVVTACIKEGVKLTLREQEGNLPRTVSAERVKLKVAINKAEKADDRLAVDILTIEFLRWSREGSTGSRCRTRTAGCIVLWTVSWCSSTGSCFR